MNENLFENLGEQVRTQVGDQFAIDSVTLARGGNALQLSGSFVGESGSAFEQIQRRLYTIGLMAMAQRERAQTLLTVVRAFPAVRPSRAWINVVLLLATILTTTMVGAQYSLSSRAIFSGTLNLDLLRQPARLLAGLPFSLSVLGILGTHELGHYFLARRHRIAVTLPYFIPFPIGLGTMGAFIKLKEPIDSRRSLFDVGIAGPLAGLMVAIPIYIVGLSLSQVRVTTGLYGSSLFEDLVARLVLGVDSPSHLVAMHPLALAGWVGFLMTSINLLPIGQLDGGHIVYALIGPYATQVARVTYVAMLLCALVYPGWLVWVILIFFVGLRHPPPLNDVTPLDTKRRVLGIATMLFAALIFIPSPFNVGRLF